MTNAIEPKELTPAQLQRIEYFKERVQAVSDVLYAIEMELEGWADLDSDEAKEWEWHEPSLTTLVKEAVVSVSSGTTDDALEALNRLQITRGIAEVASWWKQRIFFLGPAEGDFDDELPPAEEAQRRARFNAINAAMREADPELVEILDDVAASAAITIERRPALARYGLTERGLEERSAGVIGLLLEGGWRP